MGSVDGAGVAGLPDAPYTRPVAILRILTTEVGASERVLNLGDDTVRIGRADDNDVVLLEQAASRHHARVEPSGDGYTIVDLGSATGLVLRGKRVTQHLLQDGDELHLGGTRLRFVAHPASEATIVPQTSAPPSSQATEAALPPPPNPFGEADTIAPGELDPALADTTDAASIPLPSPGTLAAPHEPAPAPAPIPEPTAAPEPEPTPAAPEPAAPEPTPAVEPTPEPEPTPVTPPKSNPSFVLGGGASSPSAYTLDADKTAASGGYTLDTADAPAKSGGYSLDGERDDPVGGFRMETLPPTALPQRSGAGAYILFGVIGAAAGFGALVALQGVPW